MIRFDRFMIPKLIILASVALLFVFNYVYVQTLPPRNHQISLNDAMMYIDNFKNNPSMGTTKGGYFHKEIFDRIFTQANCVGLRYYYGKTNDGIPALVIVGVDNNGNDLENGVIGELTHPCPPFCVPESRLNK